MKYCSRMIGGLVAVGLALPAAADSLDINFSGDAAQVGYSKALARDDLEAGAALMHHDSGGNIVEADLHLVDRPEPGRNTLVLGIGGKIPYINDDHRSADGAALAIGGKLRWTLPDYNRAGVAGAAYYAPSATSVHDIDGYREYSVRGEFRILEDADIYLGYRRIELSYDGSGGDRNFDDGVYAGFNVDF
ncbi:YfaZ family outer membrane protein [Spiribacter insolitus]|uniref:YfaZ family outer membrane protein n=1 Tax=Spiribacter insolitus TaxID=3122417 RepID=A0ABV3T8V7_9GAMM